MAEDWGTGVSRTLSAMFRNFTGVVWNKGKPPLDAELNLMSQIEAERLRQHIQSQMPSGWVINPTRALEDYLFDPLWSNLFKYGNPFTGELAPVLIANVNGWILPIAGTDVFSANDTSNVVKVYPPPETDFRIDLVFLEAWQTLVAPNPSTKNKPSADKLWTFGNVMYGGTNITDDLQDPTIGFETTERVQVQYRIRVFGQGSGLGAGVSLDIYPDGIDDPNVLGQGAATAPVAGVIFSNMREELGDPSLWRSGDGDPNNGLGTVDGYSYAIPICALFRRNSSPFVAINLSGNPNQNGSFERNPSAKTLPNPLDGARILTQASLAAYLAPDATGVVQVNGLVGSGLDDPSLVLSNTFLILDDEVVGISAVDTGPVPPTITIPTGGRGRDGTHSSGHLEDTQVTFFTTRPDGIYADQVQAPDILDLRRAVNPGDWDFDRLLNHNVTALIQNNLRSTWKKSAVGETAGVTAVEVDYLQANGAIVNPNETEALDGPDGMRTIFSDATTPQPNITLMCDNDATLAQGFSISPLDANVEWDVGADFMPSAFINNEGQSGKWTNGSLIFVHIGGATGDDGARTTFRDGATRKVRFMSPQEYHDTLQTASNNHPVQLRFQGEYSQHVIAPLEDAVDAAAQTKHPGPMYPYRATWRGNPPSFTPPDVTPSLPFGEFEHPFIFLGGLLHRDLKLTGIPVTALDDRNPLVQVDIGLNFDTSGIFYTGSGGVFYNNPSSVLYPLLRGERTLYGMLTNEGRDRTGNSSELYIVMYGDYAAGSMGNNGIFKVVGAGTVGYTSETAVGGVAATSLVCIPLSGDYQNRVVNSATGGTVTVEFRSQITNSEDGNGYNSGPSAAIVGLTDLGGDLYYHPWNKEALGNLLAGGVPPDYSLVRTGVERKVEEKLILDFMVLYHPGRSGTARVPDQINRFSAMAAPGTYLRQAGSVLDPTFPSEAGTPSEETFFDAAHVQLWNRLGSRGAFGYNAPDSGGDLVGVTEQDREHELFIDRGSKTVLFRPNQDKSMTLKSILTNPKENLLDGVNYPAGSALTGIPKDGAGIFTAGKKLGFPVPQEYIPKFGRQDIPFYKDMSDPLGGGYFLNGINHLFTDDTDPTKNVFYIVGGEDNTTGGNLVKPMFFDTNNTSNPYAHWGTNAVPVLNVPAYGARKTTNIGTLSTDARTITTRLKQIHSSDLGSGLRGVMLPPYLGIARLYGVYERADFVAKGGVTFAADRVNPGGADPATNLLKTDADQQTLFLFENGARDQTSENGDHTYIIPENVLDITKIPTFVPGASDDFDDFDYVVECVVFGFAKDWINLSNYALCRRHNGQGVEIDESTIPVPDLPPELEGCHMTLPCAASTNLPTYIEYDRTVYQGDPFMTRAGNVRTTSDYEHRYGQIPTASAYELTYPIQQLDDDGNVIPLTPNARVFEVLASIDFYTSLGTGKIGGAMSAGTVLDIGHLENTTLAATRIPPSSSANDWRVVPHTFTEGQGNNDTFAELVLSINSVHSSMDAAGVGIRIVRNDGVSVLFLFKTYANWLIGPALPEWFLMGQIVYASPTLDFPVIAPNSSEILPTPVPGAYSGGPVICTVDNTGGSYPEGLITEAWVSATDTVSVRVHNTTAAPIDPPSHAFHIQVFPAGNVDGLLPNQYPKSIDSPDTNSWTARNFSDAVNRHLEMLDYVEATFTDNKVTLRAKNAGEDGNDFQVFLEKVHEGGEVALESAHKLQNEPIPARITSANFSGGEFELANAGGGFSPLNLTGVTERLPLGILLQDHDFLCEGFGGTFYTSGLDTVPSGVRPLNIQLPLVDGQTEYSRFMGTAGELVGLSDGGILQYTPYNAATTPAGTKKFRLFRGGGASYMMSGENPGGPVDWFTKTFSPPVVLKGGVLSCRATLVRNFPEVAFATANTVSEGDEIQMIIMTSGIFGFPELIDQYGAFLFGLNSPTEFGKGMTSVDRYRLNGKPMFRSFKRTHPDPANVILAVSGTF